MIRGTRNLLGKEAKDIKDVINILSSTVERSGYQPFIPSLMAEQEVFINKAGAEVLGQMYTFKDKGNRDICLIPEVTAIVQKEYNDSWAKSLPKPIRLYYATQCYRYEKPQAGRYREFWQFGVEILGNKSGDRDEIIHLLKDSLNALGIKGYVFNDSVKRGLSYYVEDGFEVEIKSLGAQKQVAGGGRYKEGIGWAIGVDRLVLAKNVDRTIGL